MFIHDPKLAETGQSIYYFEAQNKVTKGNKGAIEAILWYLLDIK